MVCILVTSPDSRKTSLLLMRPSLMSFASLTMYGGTPRKTRSSSRPTSGRVYFQGAKVAVRWGKSPTLLHLR